MSTQTHGYRTYWIIWAFLLVATLVMIAIGEANLSLTARVVLLLLGSALKASLIVFYFMHLRFEKAALVVMVLVGIFVTSLLMFMLPAYDGTQIFESLSYYSVEEAK